MNFKDKFNQLNNEMSTLLEQIQDSKIMKRQIDEGLNAVTTLTTQIDKLLIQLEKEEEDVEKLKKMSLTNFFHTLINNKSEQLNKEEMDVIEVKVKIDHLAAEQEAEQIRVDALRLKHKSPMVYQQDYNRLFNKKAQMVKDHMPLLRQELEEVQTEIDAIKMTRKEINEAVTAGNRAMEQVNRIQKSLQSASNWGTYDMLGGGLLATMAKRGHLNTAQSEMHNFQNQLRNFNRELQDVGETIDFEIQITEFLSFADWFFDGFFVDWAVQSKIKDAKDQMSQLEGKMKHILENLKSENLKCYNNLNQLERRIQGKIQGV